MTTNDLSSLDSALVRPGRVDLIIEYRKATSEQAEELFKIFYTPSQSTSADNNFSEDETEKRTAAHPFELPLYITQMDIERWSHEWSAHIENGVFSIAELQGMLLAWKKDPAGAVNAIPAWVAKEVAYKKHQEEEQAKESKEFEQEFNEDAAGKRRDGDIEKQTQDKDIGEMDVAIPADKEDLASGR